MNSTTRLCACFALGSLFASPALADEGPYLRLAAGAGHRDEDTSGSTDYDIGHVGSAAIGYNWFFPENVADIRAEFEASYRYNDIDPGSSFGVEGDAQAFSAMFNGYFDFRTNLAVVPYIGAGFGATNVRLDSVGATNVDDHDTAFTYQVMAGVNYDLFDGLAVGLEYRFLETESLSFTNSSGATFDQIYENHSALLTFTFGF